MLERIAYDRLQLQRPCAESCLCLQVMSFLQIMHTSLHYPCHRQVGQGDGPFFYMVPERRSEVRQDGPKDGASCQGASTMHQTWQEHHENWLLVLAEMDTQEA